MRQGILYDVAYGPAQGSAISFPISRSILPFAPNSVVINNNTAATVQVGEGPAGPFRTVIGYSLVVLPWNGQRSLYIRQLGTDAIQTSDTFEVDIQQSPFGGPDSLVYSPLVPNVFVRPISLGPNGGIYQGTGTFQTPGSGLKIYSQASTNLGAIAFYAAGALDYQLDTGGIRFRPNTNGGIIFEDAGGTQLGTLFLSGSDIFLRSNNGILALEVGTELSIRDTSNNPVLRITNKGHLLTAGAAPTVAAGIGAGTSPPAPILVRGTDTSGHVTFGTGGGGPGGPGSQLVVVTFAAAYPAVPDVRIAETFEGTVTPPLVLGLITSGGFAVYQGPVGTWAASQPNTTYGFTYGVTGH